MSSAQAPAFWHAPFPPVYILGGGAVGMALAVCLADAGREVTLIRTQNAGPDWRGLSQEAAMVMTDGEKTVLGAAVSQVPLEAVEELGGILVIAVKSHANAALAAALAEKRILSNATLVVMQNGLGVEDVFRSLPCRLMRCVLYMTGERLSDSEVLFRAIASSPVGLAGGGDDDDRIAARCVAALSTPVFPFHEESAAGIARHAWGKTVINAVFNSVCPLLETDNGLFARDVAAETLAAEIVREGIALAASEGVALDETELRQRILSISRGSDGVLISTLQDLRKGRPTEMEALNLELARRAESQVPPVPVPNIALLGRLVEMKGRRP